MKKYSEFDVRQAVSQSYSIAQTLRLIGLRCVGGNYKTLHKLIQQWNIDTSHFTGQGHLKGRKNTWHKNTPLNLILVKDCHYSSWKLKKRLIEENILDEKCYGCKNTLWRGQKIPLELEHIDGDCYNNTKSNLTLLCPNCHALTPTYRGRNKSYKTNKNIYVVDDIISVKDKKTSLSEDELKKLLTEHSVNYVAKQLNCTESAIRYFCRKISFSIPKRIIKKMNISDDMLSDLVKTKSLIQIGKIYGITANAVKKRCNRAGITVPGIGYWAKVYAGKIILPSN